MYFKICRSGFLKDAAFFAGERTCLNGEKSRKDKQLPGFNGYKNGVIDINLFVRI